MLLGTNSLYCLMVKCHVFILMRSSKVNSKISLPSVHTWRGKQEDQWLCTWWLRRFCNSHGSHSTRSPWLLLAGAWSWQKCGTGDASMEQGLSSEINGVKGQHSSSPAMSYWFGRNSMSPYFFICKYADKTHPIVMLCQTLLVHVSPITLACFHLLSPPLSSSF